jgi:hypothetical protein
MPRYLSFAWAALALFAAFFGLASAVEVEVEEGIAGKPNLAKAAKVGAGLIHAFGGNAIASESYIVSGKDQATREDFETALTTVCDDVPPVFLQGCQTLVEIKQKVSKDILRYKSDFEKACENAQLCWPGLMQL